MNLSEIKLVIACARVNSSKDNDKKIKHIANNIGDWEKTLRLASAHRVSALLYANLKKCCPDLVPPLILSQLKALYKENAARNLFFSAFLLKILQLFEDNNIKTVPFKGPTIAESAYGDLNLRSFSDLDILIPKKDVQKAQTILEGGGYEVEINLTGKRYDKFIEHENSLSFYHKSNISIDLHWEITGRYLLEPIYFETFVDRFQSTSFFNKKILTIPDDVLLVYLTVHGANHCWNLLEWLCCFVELAKRQTAEDLIGAVQLAEKLGAKRIFLLGLYLGKHLLDESYPEQIDQLIETDKGLVQLAAKIKKGIYAPKPNQGGDAAWRFSPIHILIRDSYLDRFRYFIYLFTMPTIKEWHYSIPVQLTPLYRLLRPFRLSGIYLNNTFLTASFKRIREMVLKKRAKGSGIFFTMFFHVPFRFIEKPISTVIAMCNEHVYKKENLRRLNLFHNTHRSKMDEHFYVIGMPEKIHFLEPCIDLIQDKINLFLIFNGVSETEKELILKKYKDIPYMDLKTLRGSSIRHGEVINLLLCANETNFGLIDHDLYIFDPHLFDDLDFAENEFVSGPFELHNKKAGITFPATFFLFFNIKIVKLIMEKYGIGAQIYSRIPKRILPQLSQLGLGYGNFLKEYLNYFDPLNLIFALAVYEGFKAKIIKVDPDSVLHLGGYQTDELLNNPEKTKKLIQSIRNRTL